MDRLTEGQQWLGAGIPAPDFTYCKRMSALPSPSVSFITHCMCRPRLFLAATLAALMPLGLNAADSSPTLYYWTGYDDKDPTWSNTLNWYEGLVPANNGTGAAVFESYDYDRGYEFTPVLLDTDLDLSGLIFGGYSDFGLSADTDTVSSVNLTIRDGVELYSAPSLKAPANLFDTSLSSAFAQNYYDNDYFLEVYFDTNIQIFADDTIWEIGYGELEVAGTLHSSTKIQKTGSGLLLLSGDNSPSLSGEVTVTEGELGLGHDNALGTATLVLGPMDDDKYIYPGLVAVDGDRIIANDVVLNGYLSTYEDDYGYDQTGSINELTLSGTVTLNRDPNADSDPQVVIENYGGLLTFDGDLVETETGTSLVIYTDESPVIFDGNSGFTGGLHVEEGAAIFGDGDALPTAGYFTTSTDGYIGLIESTLADQLQSLSDFLARFDPTNTLGVIGFDTEPTSLTVNTYNGPIDFTAFTESPLLGSLTVAELGGVITPAGSDYRFGGGGGQLRIASTLVDLNDSNTGIEVISDSYHPLTVYLNSSANSFSGTVSVENSALIFGHAPGTLPSGATLRPISGGYIGVQDTTLSVSNYLGQFATDISEGFIGFDSTDRQTPRTITDPIDLSAFTNSSFGLYLATTTQVELSGDITLPGSTTSYRFAGYKGGWLTISSVLDDGEGAFNVIIGDSSLDATGSYTGNGNQDSRSAVLLTGNNTYSGGTTLNNGALGVGSNSALGTGALNVSGSGYGLLYNLYHGYEPDLTDYAMLRPLVDTLDTANTINLYGNLIVDSTFGYTLSGDIAGSGALIKTSAGGLLLSGSNTFTGGLLIKEGTVVIASDDALTYSPVLFSESTETSQNLYFTSTAPSIMGLHDNDWSLENPSAATVNLAAGTQLTIDPNGYDFIFGGEITGDGSLTITGNGMQVLAGNNTYTGGTTLSGGATLAASHPGALGPSGSAVTLDDATLVIDENVEVAANITFGSGGGSVQGNGRLTFTEPLSFGDLTKVAPGGSVGSLDLNGPVEFASGGGLEIELGDGNNGSVISDFLEVAALNFTATALDPFTLKLTGEDGSVPYNFDPTQYYSWTVLGSDTSIGNFDLSLIDLQVDSMLLTNVDIGHFFLSIGSGFGDSAITNNTLVVNFTPVPEPSTYALFGLGLALVGWHAWRRRRTA